MKKDLEVYVGQMNIDFVTKVVKEENSRSSIVGFTGLITEMIDSDMDLPHSYKKLLKEKVIYLQLEVLK